MSEKARVEKGVSKVEWEIRDRSGRVHKMLKESLEEKKTIRGDFAPTIRGQFL